MTVGVMAQYGDAVSAQVARLLGMAPGPDLLCELLAVDPASLSQVDRLQVIHVWEKCLGWVQTQAAIATATQAGLLAREITAEVAHALLGATCSWRVVTPGPL